MQWVEHMSILVTGRKTENEALISRTRRLLVAIATTIAIGRLGGVMGGTNTLLSLSLALWYIVRLVVESYLNSHRASLENRIISGQLIVFPIGHRISCWN